MILPFLLACTPLDLPREWELDRLRLLAIRAEPAEPQPGELVRFTSLAFVPDDAEWTSVWFACVEGGEAGCTPDPALMAQLEDVDQLPPEDQLALLTALREAGFVGVQPGMDLFWSVPMTALDGLTEAEALEGVSATVSTTLATADDTEIVIKRVPVSRATTPNHNPDVDPLAVDGSPVEPGATLLLDAGNSYDLEASLIDGAEEYTYVTTSGETETRTEEPSWRWYTSGGALSEGSEDDRPSFDDGGQVTSRATWVTPDEPGTYTLAAVVLDGRGGMGWQALTVTVQ